MEGELLSLSAAFCWALGASIYKKSLSNVSPLILNLFRSSSAALFKILKEGWRLPEIGRGVSLEG